ncbi:hypothetical protein L6R52_22085 [Myxococcota bacterium]|nr:hypothetical protein [Myxococcota bacterium]
MDPKLRRELDELAAAIPEIRDQIDLAADEDAVVDDVERAERLVAGLVERYRITLARLPLEEREAVERDLGVRVEVTKAHLLKLREAP